MLDTADSGCPEHCSALIAHELSQLNINISPLREVRLHEEGSLKEHGTSYTLYWSGKPKTKSHLSGVGFSIKNSIASKQVIPIALCPYTSHYTTSNMFFLAYMPQVSKLTLWKKTNSAWTCATSPKRFLQMIRS
ncbi:hypothetical protein WISP_00535 [Willisornis vidua]|uniref:Uncharacterized protein n=1 Tax=Willisornis vidua TaxID=1566151 RepID=A0ABQ9E133_9PASS|nr:hypothetical protein WISP_00535 [Willisornis vidua]